MGFGGISLWQLLIVLAIVVLVFGTKRLKNIGTDLGSAIKGFKSSMDDEPKTEDDIKSDIKKEENQQLKQDAEFSEPTKTASAESASAKKESEK